MGNVGFGLIQIDTAEILPFFNAYVTHNATEP